MTAPLSIAPASITRRLNRAGAPVLFTRMIRKCDPSTRIVSLVASEVVCENDDDARICSAVLMQAGYEVAARKGYGQLVVTLPEPVEETPEVEPVEVVAEVAPAGLVERVAATLAPTIVPIESVRPFGDGRALVTVSDRVIGDPDRYADPDTINARAYSARGVLARAGFRETPSGAQVIVDDSHLMSDDLLDACGTAGPGGLHLVPSTTPERITCPACLPLAEEEAAVDALAATPAEADRIRASRARKRAEVVEADVPPTGEERVTVPIRASELRPGDEVIDSLGERQYAAFDVQQAGSVAPHVKVWTAIRDQENGLPPVVVMRAERELLVLRPLSEEGRELLDGI